MKLCLIVLACLVGVLAAAPTEKETKTPIVHFADGEQHIPVEVKNLNEADVRAEANALKPKKREINAADAPQAAEKKPDEVKKPEEKTESDVKAAPAEEKKSSESSEQKPAAAPVPASDEKKSDATPAEPEKAGESKTEENISGEKPAEPEKAAETKSAPAEEKKTDTNDPAESKSEEVKADPPKVAAKSEEQKKPEATVDVAVKPERIAENKPVAAAEESKPEAKSEKEVAKADAAIPAPEEKPSVSEQIPAESKTEEAKAVPAQAKVESLEQVKSESEPDVVTETENAAESTATPAADESKSEPAAESKPAATVAESKPEAESDEPAESVEGDAQEKEPSEVQVQGRSARVDIEAAPAKKTRSGKKYSDFQIIKLESEMEENGKYHYQWVLLCNRRKTHPILVESELKLIELVIAQIRKWRWNLSQSRWRTEEDRRRKFWWECEGRILIHRRRRTNNQPHVHRRRKWFPTGEWSYWILLKTHRMHSKRKSLTIIIEHRLETIYQPLHQFQ